ncbi:helix-turn-helix transcriptional regulator [Fodinisporobacter ferrooxydans]|uniref:Helix-turn-helix transcriptional regulator n=1 Tax=Fodinisporobacter ferrooxydans TaxID=2901836 RepID=A0ABY4CHB9_9BACL|nr:helix-turn-helix transcriptional regulator [Alicyclobacillaceae bacterium MYW30-H2]
MAIVFTLREILTERGISERQFAHRTGIREGTLYNILNNKISRLPVDVIDTICTELHIEPNDWMKVIRK